MRGLIWALSGAAMLAGGCSTAFTGSDFEAVSPVRNVGQDARGKPTSGPAATISIDIPKMLGVYLGQAPSPTLEEAVARFDRFAAAYPSSPVYASYRNSIVGALLAASDRNCTAYLEAMRGNQNIINGVGSALSTAFSTAATVITPEASSRLSSALASVAGGVSDDLNRAVFAERTADAIAAGIRADRRGQRVLIETRMENYAEAYWKWPLTQALSDTLDYHGRCNAVNGLSFIQSEAKKTEQEITDQRIDAIRLEGPVAAPAPPSSGAP